MQKIRFGTALGGQRGWVIQDALGETTQGPQGLLSTLELHLGLGPHNISHSERIVQMRECLKAAATGSRFYERTFEADEIGTAETLLSWRDAWYEHGWDGEAPSNSSPRIRDMASVEVLANKRVSPGPGERLRAVEKTLQFRRPQFEVITLTDPLEELPISWQRILAKLPTSIAARPSPQGVLGTTLRTLQDVLVQRVDGDALKKTAWIADGTVRVVRADTKLAGALWLAGEFAQQDSRDCAVVVEREGAMLDAALAGAGLPRLGLGEPTPFRPALQLLPLVLRLLWSPLDLYALAQFSTLPIGPLSGYTRRSIAKKLAQSPGLGGQKWLDLIADVTEHHGKEASKELKELAYWIEHERFKPEDGAPLAVVFDRVDRLASFFSARLVDPDEARRASWLAGFEQADALRSAIRTLEAQDVAFIKADMLDRLVDRATSRGTSNPSTVAQAGACAVVTDPLALVDAFPRVFWFHMSAVKLPAQHPWSIAEIAELSAAGVQLPSLNSLLDRQARGWLGPVLAAQEQLTLVLPSEAEELHPMWMMVTSVFDDVPVQHILDVLVKAHGAGLSVVPHRPLSAPKRWWSVAPGSLLPWPTSASFSSLEKMLFDPYQWVLQYPARLRVSALLDLPNDFRLLGNLAHSIVERLYRTDGALSWETAAVLTWFDSMIESIVQEEAAILLMRGKRAELESFRLRFRSSLGHLHDHLQSSGAVSVVPEAELEHTLDLAKLVTRSDLLMTRANGDHAILDLKWAGDKKYGKKLATQKHLQLAVYARVQQQHSGRWPSVAYFILQSGKLLTTSADAFPLAEPITSPLNATQDLWSQAETTWRWRVAQLQAGNIEVIAEHIEPSDLSVPPDGCVDIEPLDWRYNSFVHLAGWRQ